MTLTSGGLFSSNEWHRVRLSSLRCPRLRGSRGLPDQSRSRAERSADTTRRLSGMRRERHPYLLHHGSRLNKSQRSSFAHQHRPPMPWQATPSTRLRSSWLDTSEYPTLAGAASTDSPGLRLGKSRALAFWPSWLSLPGSMPVHFTPFCVFCSIPRSAPGPLRRGPAARLWGRCGAASGRGRLQRWSARCR
jgi:hypothetical protein